MWKPSHAFEERSHAFVFLSTATGFSSSFDLRHTEKRRQVNASKKKHWNQIFAASHAVVFAARCSSCESSFKVRSATREFFLPRVA